jgi:hypothetical protein
MSRLHFVDSVTREHGEQFTQVWYETGSIEDACAFTEIVEWPEWDDIGQLRSLDIQDEIVERIFNELRSTIASTFVRVADEILRRERER